MPTTSNNFNQSRFPYQKKGRAWAFHLSFLFFLSLQACLSSGHPPSDVNHSTSTHQSLTSQEQQRRSLERSTILQSQSNASTQQAPQSGKPTVHAPVTPKPLEKNLSELSKDKLIKPWKEGEEYKVRPDLRESKEPSGKLPDQPQTRDQDVIEQNQEKP